jgi:hypothetical protein
MPIERPGWNNVAACWIKPGNPLKLHARLSQNRRTSSINPTNRRVVRVVAWGVCGWWWNGLVPQFHNC